MLNVGTSVKSRSQKNLVKNLRLINTRKEPYSGDHYSLFQINVEQTHASCLVTRVYRVGSISAAVLQLRNRKHVLRVSIEF